MNKLKFDKKTAIVLLLLLNLGLLWATSKQSLFPSAPGNQFFLELKYPELKVLKNLNPTFEQLVEVMIEVSNHKGAAYGFELLKLIPIPAGIDTHLLAHAVGDILYDQQGVEGIKICTHDFRNACSHAIVIGVFLEEGEAGLDKISEACRQAPGGSGAYTMCFHGLGHGVLAFMEYDYPKAAKLCEQTGTQEYNYREYIECVGGATMEIIAGVHDREAWEKKYQQYLSIDNPLSLCSGDYLKSEARGICYTYITPHLINTVGGNLQNPGPNDFKKAFPLCEQIPEEFPQDRGACFAGFGKEFIVLSQERDIRDIGSMTNEQLKQTYDWCMLTKDPRGQVDCINSIGNSLFWGGENSFLLPLRFCSLINNPIHNNTCYQNIINAVFFYVDNQDYLTNFCSKLPTNYQSFCQSKIRN